MDAPEEAPLVTISLAEHLYGDFAPMAKMLTDSLETFITVGLIALPVQWLLPAVRRKPKITTYEFWLDLMYWILGAVLGLLGLTAGIVATAAFLWGKGPLFPALRELPDPVAVFLAIWAFDFVVYWRHRAEHTFSALWAFHAVHHTTEQVDVYTTSRLHPGEVFLGGVLNGLVARLGVQPELVGVAFGLYLNWNYFIHANIRIRMPGPLKYIFVSPFMHHWHHAFDKPAHGKNLGVVFAWNDWLFGTAYHPAHWPVRFGIDFPEGEHVGQTLLGHLVYPLRVGFLRSRAWARSLRVAQSR